MLIGAGSLQFGLGTVGNILASDILQNCIVMLHDINEQALNLAYKACKSAIKKKNSDVKLEKTLDRKKAIQDATFVINSIEVTPRFKLMEMDYTIPLQYGNKQLMGENGGPGGLLHSLRIIPPILDICQDIQEICPDTLFINFSNPMSRICLAIKRKYPSLKFVGLCHEFQDFYPILTKIVKTDIENLKMVAGGLNHFGVILDIKYKDTEKDAYPDIRKNGPEVLRAVEYGPYLDDSYDLIAFILETYGYLPYTTDCHYGEYLQWAWEKADISAIRTYVRRYEAFLKGESERIKKFIEKGKAEKVVYPDSERAIPIIEGIITDKNYIEPSVNVANDKIITNLPKDLVIECPAIINKDGVHGIKLGDYPKGLAALLRTQASIQDLVVESILKRSKNLAVQALLADPVVESHWQAKNILDEMLDLQSKYLQIELE